MQNIKYLVVVSFLLAHRLEGMNALPNQPNHKAGTTPVQTSPTSSPITGQPITIKNLGKNRLAQLAAWFSLFGSSAAGVMLSYNTMLELCEKAFLQMPALRDFYQPAAQLMSMMVVVPASVAALIKGAPLGWYFYYMLYAGERVSPLLAQVALRDLNVYIHHLQVIKVVQQELLSVIYQINQELGNKQHLEPALRSFSVGRVDPAILNELEVAIAQNEVHIQELLAQLQQFLPTAEINQYLAEQATKDLSKSLAADLQVQAHAIAQNLQDSDVDLGYDAVVLNQLIKDLIAYWQQYTVGLAQGLDNALQFCQNVYLVEQIIINWLDRPLVSA